MFVQLAAGVSTLLDPILVLCLVMLDISILLPLMVVMHAVVRKYSLMLAAAAVLSFIVSPNSDVDECTFGIHSCDDSVRAMCINTDGSYECVCRPGYIGNGESCIPFGIIIKNII